MGDTKKVASTGRFGSRYGVGIRKKTLKVEAGQLQKQKCPNCGSLTVKRKSKGIFICRKCLHEFIGGAYMPKTLTGGIISQMVSQKKFVPEELPAASHEAPEADSSEAKEELNEEASGEEKPGEEKEA